MIDLSNPSPSATTTQRRSAHPLGQHADAPPTAISAPWARAAWAAAAPGFTIVPSDYTVTLYNYNPVTQVPRPRSSAGRLRQSAGPAARPGITLPADDYRVYMPNQLEPTGRHADHGHLRQPARRRFLGNQTSQASPDFPSIPSRCPSTRTCSPTAPIRMDDMSGDGVAGGAFMTGFTVVPYGNVVYARPDYVENPLVPSTLSNGSLAEPYPVLAPEGDPNTRADANPTHNPNLGLNNPAFFQPGNFNVAYDFSGDGKFEQSALYAASQLALQRPGRGRRRCRASRRATRSPAGDAGELRAAAPAGPTPRQQRQRVGPVRHHAGLQAGLDAQAAERVAVRAEPGQCPPSAGDRDRTRSSSPRTTTPAVGGATNNNPDTTPHAGDWGGIVFRNYDDAIAAPAGARFPVDGILVGPNGGAAVSGAQDAMSILNFANIRYGGGASRRARATSTARSPCTTRGRRSPTTTSPTAAGRAAPRRPSAPTSTRSARTTRPAAR